MFICVLYFNILCDLFALLCDLFALYMYFCLCLKEYIPRAISCSPNSVHSVRVVHYENNQTTSNLFISRGSYRSHCPQIVLLHSVFSMLCSFYIIVTRVTLSRFYKINAVPHPILPRVSLKFRLHYQCNFIMYRS